MAIKYSSVVNVMLIAFKTNISVQLEESQLSGIISPPTITHHSTCQSIPHLNNHFGSGGKQLHQQPPSSPSYRPNCCSSPLLSPDWPGTAWYEPYGFEIHHYYTNIFRGRLGLSAPLDVMLNLNKAQGCAYMSWTLEHVEIHDSIWYYNYILVLRRFWKPP